MQTISGVQWNIHFSAGAEFLNCSPMALLFTWNLSCKLISLASHDLSVQVWVFSPDLHLPAQSARETETHYHRSLRSTTAKGGAKEVSPSLLKNEDFAINIRSNSCVHIPDFDIWLYWEVVTGVISQCSLEPNVH